jgi:Ner family transcriptional regulator
MALPAEPHAEDIKAEIRKRCGSLVIFSLMHGYSAGAAGVALRKPWPEMQRLIADYLGYPLHRLWPRWYDLDGTLKGSARSNVTRVADHGHVEKTRAA